VEVLDSGLIRLKDNDPNVNAVMDLDITGVDTIGHRLVIQNSRRIKLSPTSQDAEANAINLTGVGAGIAHAITPYGGVLAQPSRLFDPVAHVNVARDSIELGTGHGLEEGQPVVYSRFGQTALQINAAGDDFNHARSEAGSGGLVSGAASFASTDANSNTRAFIADGSAGNTGQIEVASLLIQATHNARFDSSTNSLQASAVGFSGSWATNDVDATVVADVGNYADIVTQDVQILATNRTRKDIVNGNNVQAGSGGVLQGNASESETDINNDTLATLGNHVTLEVEGDVFSPGNFLVSAFNDVEGEDDVQLDTGGLIVGSGATSNIRLNENNATAAIGDHSNITTVGDVDLQTRSRGILKTEPSVHTYGLASAAVVDSHVVVNSQNTASIGDNTNVTALGEINLLAGRNRERARNFFQLTSHGDALNASFLPIDVLQSNVDLYQNHAVDVGAGSVLRAAQDVNLIAEELATAEIKAYGTGKNWLAAVSAGIDALFGSSGISEELQGGSSTNTKDTLVNVDGSIEVGILKDRAITIDKGSNVVDEASIVEVTQNVGDIGSTFSIESVATNLVQQRIRLQDLIQEYSGDAESQAAYLAELELIEQQMRDLGLEGEAPDGTKVFDNSLTAPFITLDPIRAQSGTIYVQGASLTGSGSLNAPGDVTVSIVNNSPAYLRLDKIEIPDNEGGRVRFNAVELASAADLVNGLNFSGTITPANDSAPPSITIANTFNEDDPSNQSAPWNEFGTPDIEVVGDIDNLQGVVNISAEGSVISRANMNAGTLDISSGRDFVLTAADALFHTGGDPGSQQSAWNSLQSTMEAQGTLMQVLGLISFKSNEPDAGAATTAVNAAPISNIIAANNVLIGAQQLNVNGIIQSGLKDLQVNITPAVQSQIDAAEFAYGRTTSDPFFRITTGGLEPQVDPGTGLEFIAQENNQNIRVFYNALENRIEVNAARVQGGFMSLTGQMLSTGGGEVRALDGYGRIQINNTTSYPVLLNELDTSSGIEGVIRITDTGQTNASGKPLVTVFERIGNDIKKTEQYLDTPGIGSFHPANGIASNTITLNASVATGFANGDKLLYRSKGGAAIPGLTDRGIYYVTGLSQQNVNGDVVTTLQLAASPGGAALSLGTLPNAALSHELTKIVNSSTVSSGRTTSYSPKSTGARYFWTTGQDFTRTTKTTYRSSAWLGADALAADPSNIYQGPSYTYGTPRPLREGSYVSNSLPSGLSTSSNYTYEFERIASSFQFDPKVDVNSGTEEITLGDAAAAFEVNEKVIYRTDGASSPIGGLANGVEYTVLAVTATTIRLNANITAHATDGLFHTIEKKEQSSERNWSTTTWYGKTTYYKEVTKWQDFKNIHTHSIKADRPFNINFIGYDTGAVNVASGGDILLNGNIQNPSGNTTLTSTAGQIVQYNDDAKVGGTNVTLSAATGIGALGTVRTDLTNGNGILNATSAAGDIKLREVSGSLTVNQVTTALGTGDVTVSSQQSLFAQSSSSQVRGSFVELHAELGQVGDLDGVTFTVDTGSNERDGLAVTSLGEVSITEKTGDLRLRRIDTNGGEDISTVDQNGTPHDVRVVIATGSLIDANTTESRDPRTAEQLQSLYEKLLATEATAQQAIDTTVEAYESTKSDEYHQYWTTRRSQPHQAMDYITKTAVSAGRLFYLVVDGDQLQLANSPQQAEAGSILELDANGSTGEHGFAYGDGIGFDSTHAIERMSTAFTANQTFFAIVNGSQVQLASSNGNALAGTELPLDVDNATGTVHGFTAGGGSNFNSTTAVDSGNDTIRIAGHSFADGQAVAYVPAAGNIGLTAGQIYFVKVDPDDADLFQLTTDAELESVADLTSVAGNQTHQILPVIAFDPRGAFSAATDAFNLGTHGLTTGTAIKYVTVAGDTPVSQITGDTNQIRIPAHGFSDGDAVAYDTNGFQSSIGLSAGTLYYVKVDSVDLIRLTTDAGLSNVVDISPTNDGSQHRLLDVKTFSPGTDLSAANDDIVLVGHGFDTADPVTYVKPAGTAIATVDRINLEGQTVYLKLVAANQFQLSLTPGGAAIDLNNVRVAGSQHQLHAGGAVGALFHPVNDVDAASDTITLPAGHGLSNNQAVTYRSLVYDANYQVTLAGHELDAYESYYTDLGTADGLSGSALSDFVSGAIQTIQNKRTAEYHSLHVIYGQVGNLGSGSTFDPDAYNANFAYNAKGSSPEFALADVDGSTETISLDAKFEDLQAVVYHHGGGTSLGGLTNGQAYIVVAESLSFGSSAVSSVNNTINLGSHGLSDGDELIYRFSDGGNANNLPLTGLEIQQAYTVEVDSGNANLIRLYDSNGSVVDLDATGAAAVGHRFSVVDFDRFQLATNLQNATANPPVVVNLNAAVGDASGHYFTDPLHNTFDKNSVSGNQITLQHHAFTTGQAVQYKANGGTPIGGLVDEGVYYVMRIDGATVQLANSKQDFSFEPASDVATNVITIGANQLQDGQALIYAANGDLAIDGLVDGQTYYARVTGVAGGGVRLAASSADAVAGVNLIGLDPSTALGSSHMLSSPSGVISLDTTSTTGNRHELFEAGALASRAAWSESQLNNSLPASLLRPKSVSGTSAATEEANIVGNNITIISSAQSIGSTADLYRIRMADIAGLSGPDREELMLLLGGAEKDDVTFYSDEDATAVMEADDLNLTAIWLEIQVQEDVDVASAGVVDANAAQNLFVGSEIDILINQFLAGGRTIVKGQNNLFDATPGNDQVNIQSGTLVLEGETGSIGSVDDPLILDVQTGESVTARANTNIFLVENDGDMEINSINATNVDLLTINGAMVDANNNGNWNLFADTVHLHSATSIGALGNYLDTEVSVSLNATAPGNIHLNEVNDVGTDGGVMRVGLVHSTSGDVYLSAFESIVSASANDVTADVVANNVTIDAGTNGVTGTIGRFGADLDINSAANGAGVLTTSSTQSTHLTELAGDLSLFTVNVNNVGETAFIAVPSGAVINANVGNANVLSGKAWLFALNDIGSAANPIATTVGNIEAQSTTQSVYVMNDGALEVGGVIDSVAGNSASGIVAAQTVLLGAASPIEVTETIVSAKQIVVISTDDDDDSPGNEDHLTIAAGARLETNGAVGTPIAELVESQTYYVQVNGNDISLLDGPVGVGSPIDIQTLDAAALASTHFLTPTITNGVPVGNLASFQSKSFLGSAVNAANNTITIPNHGLSNDDRVIYTTSGTITLLAGDDLIVEEGADVIAVSKIFMYLDYGDSATEPAAADPVTSIDEVGLANRAEASIDGTLSATEIFLFGGDDHDAAYISPEAISGHIRIQMGQGNDQIFVNQLPTIVTSHDRPGDGVPDLIRDTLDLDGQAGTDFYIVQITDTQADPDLPADYIINVHDSGAADDGADQLEIHGTNQADTFLVRRYFVASLSGNEEDGFAPQYQRINYDESINARLRIHGHLGDDLFATDDNSTITTLDGGDGVDEFRFGQLFGTERDASSGVAPGDEINTVQTTRGFLSNGVSYPTTALGGDGDDVFHVYRNIAALRLEGGLGNDEFVVRAFALADENDPTQAKTDVLGGDGDDYIQYAINAPVGIDGGNGSDNVVAVGSEFDDNIVVTDYGIFGAGLNIRFDNVEKAEIDAVEGNDHFFIQSTNAAIVTTLIGGYGHDTFDVMGDVTEIIISSTGQARTGMINHNVVSNDPNYDGVGVAGIRLDLADNDAGESGVLVQPTDGATVVSENGLTDTYEITLPGAAPATVHPIYLTISAPLPLFEEQMQDGKGVMVSLDGVVFRRSVTMVLDDAADWGVPHTIHVRAEDDSLEEGETTVVISHSIISDDATYHGIQINDAHVRVIDNDKPGLILTQTDVKTMVTEGGNTDTYGVALTRAPAVGETVTVSVTANADVTANPATLTFTAANWDTPQTVTVTATSDGIRENLETIELEHTFTSDGAIFS
ncbi:MAG: hypothetical protein KDA87_06870, partial [Planctomycetales bacterium]|nr:hypothetical protein [Planctomycetales bacterium]